MFKFGKIESNKLELNLHLSLPGFIKAWEFERSITNELNLFSEYTNLMSYFLYICS